MHSVGRVSKTMIMWVNIFINYFKAMTIDFLKRLLYFFLKDIIETERQRERSILPLVHTLNDHNTETVLRNRNFLQISQVGAEAQTFGHSYITFSGSLKRAVWNGAARIWTDVQLRYWSCRQKTVFKIICNMHDNEHAKSGKKKWKYSVINSYTVHAIRQSKV